MKRSHPERERGISSVHLETFHFVQGETVEIIQQSQFICYNATLICSKVKIYVDSSFFYQRAWLIRGLVSC